MTDYTGALVSAVITTNNRAHLLPRALDSVLKQTYPHLEIIVVDDGSQDTTEILVNRYRESCDHLRYLRHDIPRGACAARNYGIREAHGEFIAGLDDDDEWLPRRVEVLLRDFHDKDAYICSPDRIIYRDRVEYKKKRTVITLEDMLYWNVTGNQILTKRERILAVGGFDEELPSAQDYDLWLRLLKRYGRARMVSEPLQNVYRDHLSERVSISTKKVAGDWRLYNKHKSEMNRDQRKMHLIKLRRLKYKRLRMVEVLGLCSTEYFWPFLRYYIRRRMGITPNHCDGRS